MQIDLDFLERSLGLSVLYFDEIDSTNLFCKERVKQGVPFEGIVIAASQTNGQGRVGKSFYSPKGSGLYLTFVFRKELFSQQNITPAVAVSACLALEEFFSVSCGIKWVNDIYIRGRKAGGILCQSVADYVLIGIGINFFKPKLIPDELKDRIGWVVQKNDEIDFTLFIRSLYSEILRLSKISDQDLLAEYRRRCVHVGCDVILEQNHLKISGKCVGIDDDFSLLVEINGDIRSFSSGFMVLKI